MGHPVGRVCRTETSRWPATATTIASPSSTTDWVGSLTSSSGQGLLDNTVVIITSDHGESFGDHGLVPSRHQPLPRRDRRPAGDPVSGCARRPGRGPARQPARSAGHGGRPAWSLGRLTVPGSLAGGLLVLDTWTAPAEVTPVLSEHATETAFQQPEAEKSLQPPRCPDVLGGPRPALHPGRLRVRDSSTTWLLTRSRP